jgi:hypothetical protein
MAMQNFTPSTLPNEAVEVLDHAGRAYDLRYEEAVDAEVLPDELPLNRAWPRRLLAALDGAWNWIFGVVSLVGMLAVVATIPFVQVLSLGYLLEASGRVARTGKLRSGFVGVDKSARLGSILLGAWLLLWIPRFISSLWYSAWLIDPASTSTRVLRVLLFVTTVGVVWHTAAAMARGGRLRHFLWPRPFRFLRRMFQSGSYSQLRDSVWDFAVNLHLPHYFKLGLLGFLGGVAWLAVPISLLAIAKSAPVLGFLGGLILVFVLLYLPFLQTRLAMTGRWQSLFELKEVRRTLARAPIASAVALLLTLALALPLYLLKIELIPREAEWLPSLLFIASIWPARLAVGWAMGRGLHRERPRHVLFRWSSRLAMLPIVGLYVLLVYFTQYLSWYGVWSLYEQHAFLLPVPFLGG